MRAIVIASAMEHHCRRGIQPTARKELGHTGQKRSERVRVRHMESDVSAPPQMGVSVIVVNYNGLRFLPDCLGSLEAQRYRNFEVVFVDNGSTDGSVEYVRTAFPWVRVITLDRNLGFCKANNIAIRETGGEAVVLLNNDTTVAPTWLEELLSAAASRSDIGIFASRILQMRQPDVLYAAGDCYWAYGHACRRGEGLPAAGRYDQPEEVFAACACAALYRRSMLDRIGLFDEDFVTGCEDVDLSFRARIAGYKVLYVPAAIVCHFGSATQGTENPRVEFLTSRNFEYVFFKNMPLALLLKFLPGHILQVAADLVARTKAGLGLPYLRGKAAFIINLRKVLRKRRAIQKTRRVPLSELTMMMNTKLGARTLRQLTRAAERLRGVAHRRV
jgi:GT2 family glycosyltransferase